MPFLIGTDEAGYGPNLGPLTVTGTLWESDQSGLDLYAALEDIVRSGGNRSGRSNQLFIADSKRVYNSSGSIANLETAVLALLYAATDKLPNNWRELVETVCPAEAVEPDLDQVWLAGRRLELPIKASVDDIRRMGDRFKESAEAVGVRLVAMQCVPVFPPQFNSRILELGNKATLLSTETLQIVRRLMDQSDDDLEIGCDKHGGRSKYAALIQQIITDELVMIGDETLAMSDYSFRENDRDVFIRFQAKGESFLPTALASMVSKYMREIFMMIWNDFWKLKIPDLKPTKGYPVDAKRFKCDIATVQKELGIDDHSIWRNK